MGKPEENAPRPWFYTWSLMSRMFGAGTRIVAATGFPAEGFRALAGVNADGRMRLMLVNNSAQAASVVVRAAGVGIADYRLYHYFENERPTDTNGFPVPAKEGLRVDLSKGWDVSLPAHGVVFLEG
jgi:hypothetical protein